MRKIGSDPDIGRKHVLILIDEGDLRFVRQQYCNFLEIPDQNELQMEMHGFYYGKTRIPYLGWYERNVLAESYRIYSTYYTWNGTHVRDESLAKKDAGVALVQVRQVFFMLLIMAGIATVSALLEWLFARIKRKNKETTADEPTGTNSDLSKSTVGVRKLKESGFPNIPADSKFL